MFSALVMYCFAKLARRIILRRGSMRLDCLSLVSIDSLFCETIRTDPHCKPRLERTASHIMLRQD